MEGGKCAIRVQKRFRIPIFGIAFRFRGKSGTGFQMELHMKYPPRQFFTEKKIISAIEYDTANGAMRLANIAQSGQCQIMSLEHHLHHALKGLLPIRDALNGI